MSIHRMAGILRRRKRIARGSDHGDHNRSTEGAPAETAHCALSAVVALALLTASCGGTYGAAEDTGAGA